MYLITAKYKSDSERKRIEYILDKWKNKMRISKPEGIVAIASSDDVTELITDLYSRTTEKNVTLYNIESTELDLDEKKQQIRVKINESRDTSEKLIDFIMLKQKATLDYERNDPRVKAYQVYTKKGKAKIMIEFFGDTSATEIKVQITGYGEVVGFLYSRLAEELRLLGD